MTQPLKQHLIDPEICIRCHTCEDACPIGAITHNDDNVVVDADKCEHCLHCIAPCPTGSIDNWRVVSTPYSVQEQLVWFELPEQEDIVAATLDSADAQMENADVIALLAQAQQGAGEMACAPASAARPVQNLFTQSEPLCARVQGNFRLTEQGADSDVRHIILDLGNASFPYLEGQSIGITPPGTDQNGRPHRLRLYTVSSPRTGERPGTNNLSLTVKRENHGLCSNYICDLKRDDMVNLTGPFGSSFLIPNDAQTRLIMVCTGTGSAPFRAFTMQRQREMAGINGSMKLFFGARTPQSLPYFGPLDKVPSAFLDKHFAFSRVKNSPKTYVQDQLRADSASVTKWLIDRKTYIYICGLKAMESGVEAAFLDIMKGADQDWQAVKSEMLKDGRYHVETY